MPQRIPFTPRVDVDVAASALRLYGTRPGVGAVVTAASRCSRCGGRFRAGDHVIADLAPGMAGTARHVDCRSRCADDARGDCAASVDGYCVGGDADGRCFG